MKKIILIILSMCLIFNTVYPAAFANEQEVPYTISGARIVCDDRLIANGAYLSKGSPTGFPSGWDGHSLGGNIKNGWGTFFLEDTSKYLSLDMTKKFGVVSGYENVTFETYFSFDNYLDNMNFALRDDKNEIISFVIRDKKLFAAANNSETLILDGIEEKVYYGLKLNINQIAKSAEIYVSAKSEKTVLNIGEKADFDNVYIETGKSDTGKVNIMRITITAGYFVNETFFTNTNNKAVFKSSKDVLYNDWNYEGGIEFDRSFEERDSNLVKLFQGSEMSRSYSGGSDITKYRFFVNQPEKSNGFEANLGGEAKLLTDGGNICYLAPGGEKTVVYKDYRQNLWYTVAVETFKKQGSCTVYINEKKVAENLPIGNTENKISFKCGEKAVKIDTITVEPRVAAPEDYVEEPKAVKPDREIGMQSCSLWREGEQFGWDTIKPHPEREPYLGYYDESKPEVSDWEIKWMTEHGITFQQFCWFRNGGGDGNAIMPNVNSIALNEGYMNAKYSDKLKFSIMFENVNSGFSGIDDFKNNLVPYWIEYYFKDSRYMTIDNKPILSFFNLQKLVDQMGGSNELVKQAMDYLGDECKKIGYDGIFTMAAAGITNAQMLKECGIDCVYAYNWGSAGGSVQVQESGMDAWLERDMDFIPTISMGWDDTAWGGNGGRILSLEDYKTVAAWVKSDYSPRAKYFGKKMLMLGNWNELGEGHYMIPSGLSGFDYLDIIKDVFAGKSSHTDLKPTENQKQRINSWYDQTRELEFKKSTVDESEYPTEIVKEWDFNDGLQGWTKLTNVKELSVENGAMKIVASGSDVNVQSPENMGIDISEVSYIKMRIKNMSPMPYSQLFYITSEHTGGYTETGASCSTFYPSTNDTEFHDYYIKVEGKGEWKGKLNRMRFDPFDQSPGSVCYVDSITLLKYTKLTENKISFNGKDYNQAPVNKNGLLYMPVNKLVEYANLKYETADDGNKYIIASGENVTEITAGEKAIVKNTESVAINGEPFLDNGTLYISDDTVRKILDCAVGADMEKNNINIITGITEWYFKNGSLDGWSLSTNLSYPFINSDYLRVKNSGYDASLYSDEALSIPGSSITGFSVKMKNETSAEYARMYYKTTESPEFSDDKCITFKINPNEKSFTEYSASASLKGTVTQLRFVFTNQEGNSEIEYIRMKF